MAKHYYPREPGQLGRRLWSMPLGNVLPEAGSWTSLEKLASPVDPSTIPHFREWINFNPFAPDHKALDFTVYLNKFDQAVVGLPRKTPIYAVADGVVVDIDMRAVMFGGWRPPLYDHYQDAITITHSVSAKGKPVLFSRYVHVTPKVKEGQAVSRGQKIGEVYADRRTFFSDPWGRVAHLHFQLAQRNEAFYDNPFETPFFMYQDPEPQLPEAFHLQASPQRHLPFVLEGKEADIRIANFPLIQVPESFGKGPSTIVRNTFTASAPTYSRVERLRELVQHYFPSRP